MNNRDLVNAIKGLGLSDKAARVYLANIALGETTVMDLARKSKVSRTSVYYTLEELKEKGLISEVERGNKTFIMYVEPEVIIKDARARVLSLDEILPDLEEMKWSEKRKPRVEFYFGPAGFKEVWWKLFTSECSEFRIMTDAGHFGGYVKEKYIADEIIAEKKRLNIKSRQIITESNKAKFIVAKDGLENRKSKYLPPEYVLGFTEIIAPRFVAFISPREQNVMFTVDHLEFAETRASTFDALWDKLV